MERGHRVPCIKTFPVLLSQTNATMTSLLLWVLGTEPYPVPTPLWQVLYLLGLLFLRCHHIIVMIDKETEAQISLLRCTQLTGITGQ